MVVGVGNAFYRAGPSAPAVRCTAQGKRWLHRRSWRLQVGPGQGRRVGSPAPSTAVAQRSLGKRHAHLSGRSPAMPPPASLRYASPPENPCPPLGVPPRGLIGGASLVPPGTLQRLNGRSVGLVAWLYYPPGPPRGERKGWRQSRALKAHRPPPQPPPRRGSRTAAPLKNVAPGCRSG